MHSKEQPDKEGTYVLVMDHFGTDWTPFVALTNISEATKVRDKLSKDADSICETAPYYPTKDSVRGDGPSSPPTGLETLSVAFDGKEALGISENPSATREVRCEEGGLQGEVEVYDTAAEVIDENPTVTGEFIDADITVKDMVGEIR